MFAEIAEMEDTREPMQSLEWQMSQLESSMVYWLNLYLVIQGALLSSVFSVQLPEGATMGCALWRWSPLILSALASVAMTVALLGNLFEQFGLIKLGRGRNVYRWLLKRAAFLVMFIAFSLCILCACTRLLCSELSERSLQKRPTTGLWILDNGGVQGNSEANITIDWHVHTNFLISFYGFDGFLLWF